MKKIISFSLLALIFITLIGWSFQHHAHKTTHATSMSTPVFTQQLHQSLYFTGIIQPLNETALTSPVEAIIEKIHHNYGESLHLGDVVLTLNSRALEKQYNETFTEYLKSKDTFEIAQAKFNGTQELWDAGLISKNNYLSEQSSLNTMRITFLQAKQKLTEIREKINDKQDVSNLDINQFNQIQKELDSHHNLVDLKAHVSGVLLYPPKNSMDKISRITLGAHVKANQIIALIGDTSGIHIDIEIPETDIQKIHLDMPAHITSTVLGQRVLMGKVVSINTQATPGQSGNASFFNASVEVKNLSDEARSTLKIGMSATIELIYESEKQLMIPIKAVRHIEGKKQIIVQHQDGTYEKREVITGAATADQVVIEHGLQAGERVVYDA